jgi:hypothetical protein
MGYQKRSHPDLHRILSRVDQVAQVGSTIRQELLREVVGQHFGTAAADSEPLPALDILPAVVVYDQHSAAIAGASLESAAAAAAAAAAVVVAVAGLQQQTHMASVVVGEADHVAEGDTYVGFAVVLQASFHMWTVGTRPLLAVVAGSIAGLKLGSELARPIGFGSAERRTDILRTLGVVELFAAALRSLPRSQAFDTRVVGRNFASCSLPPLAALRFI